MPAQPEGTLKELKAELQNLQEKISNVEEEGGQKEVKDLYSWRSPSRAFVKKDPRWRINTGIGILIIVVILLLTGQFMLMAAFLAVIFVLYVLITIPPEEVGHNITTEGVTSANHSYVWEELADFWFTKRRDWVVLNVETKLRFPARLHLLLAEADEDKVKNALAGFLSYREVPKQTWLDSISEAIESWIH